jgi:hypothetical protein
MSTESEVGCVEAKVDEVETDVDARVSLLDFFDPLTFLVLDFMKTILTFLLILIMGKDWRWKQFSAFASFV